ncbi:short stature homeobox protein [Sigmodon hispidus]
MAALRMPFQQVQAQLRALHPAPPPFLVFPAPPSLALTSVPAPGRRSSSIADLRLKARKHAEALGLVIGNRLRVTGCPLRVTRSPRKSPQNDRKSPQDDRNSPQNDRNSPQGDRNSPQNDRKSPQGDQKSPEIPSE